MLTKHLGSIVKYTGEKNWSWMGDLNQNTEYLVGTMMTRPRAGVQVFERSDWLLYFFPEDVRVVNINLKEKEPRTRGGNRASKFELSKEDYQHIMDSLKRDS